MDDIQDQPSNKTPGMSPEDEALWAHVTQDIKPIEGRAPLPPPPVPSSPQPPKAKAPKPNVPISAPAPQKQADNQGLDTRTRQKLERGQMDIEGTLDLHDHTQAQAHTALIQFLQAAHNTGKRCVLVITGKGTFSKTAEKGILKRRFQEWVAEDPLKSIVLHHAPAKKHGGGGAFYVLIRRKRGLTPF